ncbi:MAG TPA: hypothetical protein VKP03_02635 [Patescibacteria group bacterium]|nr:hypothetical protein [Patescibacteria group bacterium]
MKDLDGNKQGRNTSKAVHNGLVLATIIGFGIALFSFWPFAVAFVIIGCLVAIGLSLFLGFVLTAKHLLAVYLVMFVFLLLGIALFLKWGKRKNDRRQG